MIKQNQFKDYSEYTQIQAKRSLKTRKNTMKRKGSFSRIAQSFKKKFPEYKNILCVGCRDKSEVMAFTEQGFNAIGIDLTECDGILQCDMSKIHEHDFFKDKKIDICFCSHVLEHCLDFEGFKKGIEHLDVKVIYVECPLRKSYSSWDCTVFDFMEPRKIIDEESILKYFNGFKIIESSLKLSKRKNMSSIKFSLKKI